MNMDVEPVLDAEIISVSRPDAERLDKRIRLIVDNLNNNLVKLYELVELAKIGEIHAALGFPSWTAYIADVFHGEVRLDREHRRELVAYLSGEGMSQRAIAGVVGVARNTAKSDLRAQVDQFDPPAPRPVTGLDGKCYPPSRPRRGPIIDEFRGVSLKLYPLETKIRKLIADDRIARNRDALRGHRNDLIRFRDTLNDVIDQLGGDVG